MVSGGNKSVGCLSCSHLCVSERPSPIIHATSCLHISQYPLQTQSLLWVSKSSPRRDGQISGRNETLPPTTFKIKGLTLEPHVEMSLSRAIFRLSNIESGFPRSLWELLSVPISSYVDLFDSIGDHHWFSFPFFLFSDLNFYFFRHHFKLRNQKKIGMDFLHAFLSLQDTQIMVS